MCAQSQRDIMAAGEFTVQGITSRSPLHVYMTALSEQHAASCKELQASKLHTAGPRTLHSQDVQPEGPVACMRTLQQLCLTRHAP